MTNEKSGWGTGISYVGPGEVQITNSKIYAQNPIVVEGAQKLTVTGSVLSSEQRTLTEDQLGVLKEALVAAGPGKEEQALRNSSVGRWLEQQSFTAWASLAAAVASLLK